VGGNARRLTKEGDHCIFFHKKEDCTAEEHFPAWAYATPTGGLPANGLHGDSLQANPSPNFYTRGEPLPKFLYTLELKKILSIYAKFLALPPSLLKI
jgi:hypothetical protein